MYRGILFAILLTEFSLEILGVKYTPVIETSSGPVRGIMSKTIWQKKKFYTFLGLPYAKPPIGDLRYRPPEPMDKWTKVWKADEERSECLQMGFTIGTLIGDEDCLYLNVYTPKIHFKFFESKLPVLIFIHGGSFSLGHKNMSEYGPEYLMEQDIILVVFNYRLGILGFPCLSDCRISCNLGLKDQTFALRWIQQNIEYFGGDASKVTVSGESAGAVCANLHMLSKMSEGLFHRVIFQSGVVLCPWAFYRPEESEKDVHKVLRQLGYSNYSNDEVVKILKTTSAHDLVNATNMVANPELPLFLPTLENMKTNCGEKLFLTECPWNKLLQRNYKQVPVLLGRTANELVPYVDFLKELYIIALNTIFLTANKSSPRTLSISAEDIVSNGVSNLSNETKSELITFLSKFHFDVPIDLIVDIMSCTNEEPIYNYIFSYESEKQAHRDLYGVDWEGVGDGDDLQMMFYVRLLEPPTDPEDPYNIVARKISCLWGNFVKTGNPTPNGRECIDTAWESMQSSGQQLDMNYTFSMMDRIVDDDSEAIYKIIRTSAEEFTGCPPSSSKFGECFFKLDWVDLFPFNHMLSKFIR